MNESLIQLFRPRRRRHGAVERAGDRRATLVRPSGVLSTRELRSEVLAILG